MKKIIAVIILLLGVGSLIAGVTIYVSKIKEEKRNYEELKTSIVNDYEVFKGKIESFSDQRTNIYQTLNSIAYYSDIANKYESLISDYKKYEEIVKEIDVASKGLKTHCQDNSFTEVDIKNKIEAFIINYEQAINYFIQDVNKLNERIKEYNNGIDNLTGTSTYKKLEEFTTEYTEYVDINNDGIFNGVELEESNG